MEYTMINVLYESYYAQKLPEYEEWSCRQQGMQL